MVTRAPRDGGYRHGRFGWDYVPPAAVWAVPAYGFGYLPQVWASPAPGDFSYALSERREEGPSTGFLRLEVQPEGLAQLYVDGYYVGRPSDFNRDVEVEAGAHTIEIRAPGHETLQFDVNVSPRGWISYRGALKPVSAPPPPGPSVRTRQNAVPQQPTTFYVIPGCYAGNVPPKDAGLPATCDQRQVMKFRP